MFKQILAAALTVGAATTAFAANVPSGANDGKEFLTVLSTTNLGGGLYGYNVGVYSTQAVTSAYYADVHFSSSQIKQVKAFSALDVDTEASATTYTSIVGSGYAKTQDSWISTPWACGPSYYGGTGSAPAAQSSTDFSFAAGSGTSSLFLAGDASKAISLAYIVAGEVLNFEGRISFNGAGNTQVGSFSAVPEPATLGLAGIAAMGLLARRRIA